MDLKELFIKFKEYYKYTTKKNLKQQYFILIYMKNIKKFKVDIKRKDKIDYDKMNKQYKIYIISKVGSDNNKEDSVYNIIGEKERNNEYAKIDFGNYIKNNVNNKYVNKRTKMVKVFNKLNVFLDRKGKISKSNKNKIENLVEDYSNNLQSRKVTNKMLNPHYFFTTKYNEKIKQSQIRHWTSSVYSFLKIDKISINYLDNYASKLIKLFFNVKYIKKRLVLDSKLMEGFFIKTDLNFINNINNIIDVNDKSSHFLKTETGYEPRFLRMAWVKNQLTEAISMSRIIKQRKLNFYTGFYPKRKSYIRKLSRVLLSKPLFKHTSLNLIIDLFIYNNKRYKFKKIKNLTVRRSLYKYMYSMYVDYAKKIKQTINRPHFFYMNLIQPNIYNKYTNIIHNYNYYFIKNSKSLFIYICILALKLNYNIKNNLYSIINNINNNNYNNNKVLTINKVNSSNIILNNNIIYAKSFKESDKKNILLPYNTNRISKYYLYDINKNIAVNVTDDELLDDNKKDKNIKEKFSKYALMRKYIKELEKKSNNPIDIDKLSLWNTDGMGSIYSTPTGKVYNDKKSKRKFWGRSYTKNRIVRDDRIVFLKDQSIYNSNSGQKKKRIRDKNRIAKKYDLHDSTRIVKFQCGVLLSPAQCNNEKFNWNKHVVLPTSNKLKYIHKKTKNNLSKFDIKNNNLKRNIKSNLDKKNIKYKLDYLNLNINTSKTPILNLDSNNIINKEKKVLNLNIDNTNLNDTIQINIENKEDIFKNKYIKKLHLNILNENKNKSNNNNLINSVTSTFYLNNISKEEYLNENKNKNTNINEEEYLNLLNIDKYNNMDNYNNISSIKRRIDNLKRIHIYNNKLNFYFNKKDNTSTKRSKELWDNFDSSIFDMLSQFVDFNKKGIYNISSNEYNSFYNEIHKLKGYGSIWYVIYFLGIIKKEYEKVHRDVIISKEFKILPYSYDILHRKSYNENQRVDSIKYTVDKGTNDEINFRCWPYVSSTNDVNDTILQKDKGYNEEIFKPYYRSMISFLIISSYFKLLNNIGKYNIIELLYTKLNENIKSNLNIDYNIYNIVTVKVLLDLIRYNYKSIIRIKPRYYYINKLRLYIGKFRRVNLNSWIASIRFVKKLRNTPKNFWLRFHILASTFFNHIVRYTELGTKRDVLLPFVVYIEDILYTIYGKWVLVRLWPLKRYYLSSYILAGRVLTLILWRKKKFSGKFSFQRVTTKLIAGIRILQIKKAYDFYIDNSYRWPIFLLNKMNNNLLGKFNYNNLEYYNHRQLRHYKLESYVIPNYTLYSYFSSIKNNYLLAYNKNIKSIKKLYYKKKVWKKKISNLQFMFYWLRPLKTYINTLNKSFDISGLKLRLSGRSGTRRNNLRSTYKNRIYGNLIGPIHYNKKTKKYITIPSQKIRGYLKSNIDFALKVSKSKNGALSLKVWISSVFSTDLRELLLHLVKIKYIYSQLINRFYIVNPYFIYIKNNYIIKSPNKNIIRRKKRKNKFYHNKNKYKFSRIPFYNKKSKYNQVINYTLKK